MAMAGSIASRHSSSGSPIASASTLRSIRSPSTAAVESTSFVTGGSWARRRRTTSRTASGTTSSSVTPANPASRASSATNSGLPPVRCWTRSATSCDGSAPPMIAINRATSSAPRPDNRTARQPWHTGQDSECVGERRLRDQLRRPMTGGDEQRCVGDTLEHHRHEIQRYLVRPVEVVEHDEARRDVGVVPEKGGQPVGELDRRQRQRLGRRRGRHHRRERRRPEVSLVRSSGQSTVRRGDGAHRPDDLDPRPQRGRQPWLGATPDRDPPPAGRRVARERLEDRRLPDPGITFEQQQSGAASRGELERLARTFPLGGPPDHGDDVRPGPVVDGDDAGRRGRGRRRHE